MNVLRFLTSISVSAMILLFTVTIPLSALDPSWGTDYREFVKIRSSSIITEFKPAEKPKYKHKILNFITGINPEIINQINIVRIRSNPVKDYMFVNQGLYTVKENWDVVSIKHEKKIYLNLRNKYGKPEIKNDGNLRIISFKKRGTKVIYYRLLLTRETARCAIYYYSTRMFRMLFMNN